jgi:energy-coupling factor transporter ATP-binding protein EcfA2
MFEHLRIGPVKGFEGGTLTGLGKINVLCGKNNSGKTTILEAISGANKELGRSPSSDEVIQFCRSIVPQGFLRAEFSQFDQLISELTPKIADVFRSQGVWFEAEHARFVSAVIDKCANYPLSGYPINNTDVLLNQFRSLFSHSEPIILIPPKRSLDLKCNITAPNVKAHGEGIVNQLFYLKNRPRGSEEHDLYNRIEQAFRRISSDFSFDIAMTEGGPLALSFANPSREWRPAPDCGLGLQDLLVVVFFSLSPQFSTILIEEPESHLHPEIQKKLLYFLKEADKQFFLTTHSNVFLDSSLVDKVFFTSFRESIELNDATARSKILSDIGYSVTDNLVSDLVILVEGPSDRPVYEEFLTKMGLRENYDVKIWALGGDIMDQLDLTVFAQNYQIVAVVDRDPQSDSVRRRFEKNCEANRITVHRLDRYSIENYFPVHALRSVFGSQISSSFTEVDPKVRLSNQIGIDVRKNNRKLAENTSLDDIKGTDLFSFLKMIEKTLNRSE